ncbi:hypothetical protein ACIQZB_42240 [Streptomyces sp. NPDC097727]|uniref:hypothetical protein n=1 Tax=Streptomyces sp. NPDC097727 TaxID=3366092 RepID=UPI003814790F
MPVGKSPTGVGLSPDGGFLYVANGSSNNVSLIDTRTNRVASTIPVGESRVNVAFSPDGGSAYVANSGSGSLSVINTRTRRVDPDLPAGRSPVGVAITPDGTSACVADEVAAHVLAVETRTGKVATVSVGEGACDVAVGPGGRFAYSADLGPGNVSVSDTGSHRVSSTIALGLSGTDPFNLEVTSEAIYVTNQGAGTLKVIDPYSHKVVATVILGAGPYGVAVS